MANVYANELRLTQLGTIGVDKDEIERALLLPGDLLIVEGNGSKDQIGRVAIWDGSIERCVHQNHIIKVRLVDNSLGPWILWWLLSPPGRKYIEMVASSTTGLYTLSINKVGELPIPLPPPDEQSYILHEVQARLSGADQLASTLEQQLVRSGTTRHLLLREAFSGHLLPQNPEDEPASALLDRIRASRESEAQELRIRRMSKQEPRIKRMSKVVDNSQRRSLLAVLQEHRQSMTPEQLFRESGYEQEFQAKECRQEVVDKFYEELRQLVGPEGPILEKRPDRETVLLEVKQ